MASRVTKRAVIRLAMLVLHWCSSEAPMTSGAEAEHGDGAARRRHGNALRCGRWAAATSRSRPGPRRCAQARPAAPSPCAASKMPTAALDHGTREVDPQQRAEVHLALQRRHDRRAQRHDREAEQAGSASCGAPPRRTAARPAGWPGTATSPSDQATTPVANRAARMCCGPRAPAAGSGSC